MVRQPMLESDSIRCRPSKPFQRMAQGRKSAIGASAHGLVSFFSERFVLSVAGLWLLLGAGQATQRRWGKRLEMQPAMILLVPGLVATLSGCPPLEMIAPFLCRRLT